MPNTREKLIELIEEAYYCDIEGIADHLIAGGVTVKIKKEKPAVDLTGKCGSCVYASYEAKEKWQHLQSYLRCINPTKRFIRETAAYKARTTPCCKAYKAKEDANDMS